LVIYVKGVLQRVGLQFSDAKTEVIDGVEIIFSPPEFTNHNFVKDNVFGLFRAYLKGNACVPHIDGHKVILPSLRKGDYLVPDFFVVCDRTKIKRDGIYGTPDLVVEVISPRTAKTDRGRKKDLYQENGVKEYWLIDPDAKSIEVYLLKGGVYSLDEVYRVPDENYDDDKESIRTSFSVNMFPDLVINLDDVFEYVYLWL